MNKKFGAKKLYIIWVNIDKRVQTFQYCVILGLLF